MEFEIGALAARDARELDESYYYIGNWLWSLWSFGGKSPNNSVYLAPIGWDITRKTVLTTKP